MIKRFFDFICSLFALIILLPLLLFIAIAIKIETPGTILFKQKRIGINKSYFYILKFRTMHTEAPKDCPTHLLQNPDNYITRLGKFLRKTSLDELPQIVNILKGEMSIVGPRPALYNQYDLIEARDLYHANDIKPGLTGWAQINGRDELSVLEKVSLDGYYVNHMSFIFDIKIIILTIFRVFSSRGVVEGVTIYTENEEINNKI